MTNNKYGECMNTGDTVVSDGITVKQSPAPWSAAIRLVVIPLAVYAAWLIETFLLEGNVHLFEQADPMGIILYTIVACIIVGMVVPVLCIHRSIISGAVNMFQMGFRPIRRTVLVCAVTCIIGYTAVILFNPFRSDRFAFANAFLLLLPTAIASVMICWVLVGTHVQASVRSGGALVSISTGVVVTSVLFGMTTLVYTPAVRQQDTLFWSVCAGIIVALFFFSVRDVYAASLIAAGCSVFIMTDRIDPRYLHNAVPAVPVSAALAVGVLGLIHGYLSWNYRTIRIPET